MGLVWGRYLVWRKSWCWGPEAEAGLVWSRNHSGPVKLRRGSCARRVGTEAGDITKASSSPVKISAFTWGNQRQPWVHNWVALIAVVRGQHRRFCGEYTTRCKGRRREQVGSNCQNPGKGWHDSWVTRGNTSTHVQILYIFCEYNRLNSLM